MKFCSLVDSGCHQLSENVGFMGLQWLHIFSELLRDRISLTFSSRYRDLASIPGSRWGLMEGGVPRGPKRKMFYPSGCAMVQHRYPVDSPLLVQVATSEYWALPSPPPQCKSNNIVFSVWIFSLKIYVSTLSLANLKISTFPPNFVNKNW